MRVTVDLSDKQVDFLRKMIASDQKFENITTMEEAVLECINIAMFDEGESLAMQEGL
ncbi:MAG TPA: hypothetical protein VF790_14225 [Dissulfurispiraceae bacterium]